MTAAADDIPENIWRAAEELAEAVHHRMPVTIARLLDGADMPALCVALAALVDTGQSRRELLAWANLPMIPPRGCGSPNFEASYKRHRYHGQTCVQCDTGRRKERRAA